MQNLEACDCRVLFVSYSDKTKKLQSLWITEWCKKNIEGTSAKLLLDPTKSAYEAYSIGSSLVAAYGLKNVWYYVKAICCRGRRSIEVQGEAGQLGADFVIAPGGTIVLKHYCQNPTDRVKVSKIIEAVESCRKQR